MSKSLKKKNHWTNKVHEAVITRSKEGELGFELKGGAENGQFPHFGEVKQGNKAAVQIGKLAQDELLLEVNDMPVAGLTTRDVLAVIKHCKDPVRFKCVKQGGVVDKDLRHYLNLRFSKGSVDHDHQQIIRDNLYLRTVPWKCLFLSGLSEVELNYMHDESLPGKYGIGFTNMAKNLEFGLQPYKIPETGTVCYLMPSSSPRCAQFPRAQDKVHFYIKLKELRDQIKGSVPSHEVLETEYSFDLQLAKESQSKRSKVDPEYENCDRGGREDARQGTSHCSISRDKKEGFSRPSSFRHSRPSTRASVLTTTLTTQTCRRQSRLRHTWPLIQNP
ncbi:hypothetical protein CRUP_017795 [Coryphaenoides rupestris]|nr:hypothetical protein CRUP_017795 [Coryphaenoides rupestris]